MPRRLDVPRPPPVKASLSPQCRRLQAQVADICRRSPRHAAALQTILDLATRELDDRDQQAIKRRA